MPERGGGAIVNVRTTDNGRRDGRRWGEGMPPAEEVVIDPRTIRTDLAPALAALLLKACAPYRNERFATAQEMRDALQEARNGRT